MLIDTHAHLTDERYTYPEEIIENMAADGLEKIICVGYDMASSLGSFSIAQNHENIYCAVGFHPCDVAKMKDGDCEKLLALSKDPKCVAIGEIGLDYHYDDTDKPAQFAGLEKMFELVKAADLPAAFHVRDADGDMMDFIEKHLDCLPRRGVLHCFSGSKETALRYIEMGFYISFAGAVTFRNAVKFPEIIKALPLDKILVETDCPYLTPVPHRGELNYPKYVRYQAAYIANVLSLPTEEIERRTTANAYALFTKMN